MFYITEDADMVEMVFLVLSYLLDIIRLDYNTIW